MLLESITKSIKKLKSSEYITWKISPMGKKKEGDILVTDLVR